MFIFCSLCFFCNKKLEGAKTLSGSRRQEFNECVTWRCCGGVDAGGRSSRVRLAWMAENSLEDGLVWSSAAPEWLVSLTNAAAETLGDDMMAALSERSFFLWVSVFRRCRRWPHLHDGFDHASVRLTCRHTEEMGR